MSRPVRCCPVTAPPCGVALPRRPLRFPSHNYAAPLPAWPPPACHTHTHTHPHTHTHTHTHSHIPSLSLSLSLSQTRTQKNTSKIFVAQVNNCSLQIFMYT